MINLWENRDIPFYNNESEQEVIIEPYLIESKEPVGAVIIFPGGGYGHLSKIHEGEETARFYNSEGFNAFVVSYRLAPDHSHPAMLLDAIRAIKYVRYNAEKFNVNPEMIGVLGFSAGGHLAGTLLTHYDFEYDKKDKIDEVSAKPNAAILCYGVISLSSEAAHIGSRNNLLCAYNDEEKKELADFLSAEKHVDENTSPVFLWHTMKDDVVSAQNSIDMALALQKKKVPYELHIFPSGGHGMGLAKDKNLHTSRWAGLSSAWLKEEIGFTYK